MVWFIVSIIIALKVSFLCSMLEACLLSLSNSDLAKIAEKQPFSAHIWKTFKLNIQKPLAVILIINTFAHTIGASVSGAQFNKLYGNKWIAVYSLLFSLLMIQWTEILPKNIAVRYVDRKGNAREGADRKYHAPFRPLFNQGSACRARQRARSDH